jgi:hypothetical protein
VVALGARTHRHTAVWDTREFPTISSLISVDGLQQLGSDSSSTGFLHPAPPTTTSYDGSRQELGGTENSLRNHGGIR